MLFLLQQIPVHVHYGLTEDRINLAGIERESAVFIRHGFPIDVYDGSRVVLKTEVRMKGSRLNNTVTFEAARKAGQNCVWN